MGTSMASVAFRRPETLNWLDIKVKIMDMFQDIDGLVTDLDQEKSGYAIVSPYGDMGMFLQDLPAKISNLTGSYAVFSICVDSDFCFTELYANGKLLEKGCIGECYMEFDEFPDVQSPNSELWKPLLLNPADIQMLNSAFVGNEVFVEDQLRQISKLTGLPIFDDKLVYGEF